MLGFETYARLAEEGKLPPNQFFIGGHLIQLCGAVISFFAPWPIWAKIAVFVGLMGYGEIVIQHGWPFWKKPQGS